MRYEDTSTTNGTALIDPAEPVEAGSFGAWTITYTVGAEGLAIGGSVRFEIPYGFIGPQFKWPADPGYTSVDCSRRSTELALSLDPPVPLDAARSSYVTRWGRMVYVQVREQPLQRGDQIRLHYGRRTLSGPGAVVQHFAQRVEFTVATDVTGTRAAPFSGYTLLAEQPQLEVVGGATKELRVVAPSLVAAGADFPVRVLPVDEYGNLSPYALPLVELVGHDYDLNVEEAETLPRGRVFTAYFDLPGQKLIEVEGTVFGCGNPMICLPRRPELQLFWGDLHGHTLLSDGLGSPQSYYEYGRDEAFLDFCAIADHAQYLSDEDWQHLQEATGHYHDPGSYVTFLGYEYSCNAPPEFWGDKCLYYPGAEGPLLREADTRGGAADGLAAQIAEWKRQGAMMVLHQHARGTCSFYDPDLVRLAEVYSVWGGAESEHCSRPLLPAQDFSYEGHYAADALELGWVLGFVGGSDDHAGHPGTGDWLRVQQAYPGGLVAAWAPELTREAIWDALFNRRCYATTGARIIIEFTVDGEPMGSVITGTAFSGGNHRLSVRVLGTEELQAVEVLRGRELIHVETSFAASLAFEFVDSPPPGAANHYYVRVLQTDGEMAWSSPIWVM